MDRREVTGHTRDRLSSRVITVAGALLLVAAVVLGILGSFAYLALASVGLLLLAAGLILRAVPARGAAAAALMALAGLALLVFGMVATPIFYLGWGILAGAVALAFVAGRR